MPRQRKSEQWAAEFARWLQPFLAALPRCTHRRWAPRYVEGLLGPAERKSMERLADRVAAGDYDQLHHFLTTTARDAAPLFLGDVAADDSLGVLRDRHVRAACHRNDGAAGRGVVAVGLS